MFKITSKSTKESKVQKASNAWSTNMNPLNNLTSTQITQLIEQMRHGNDIRLQTAFYQMEKTTPIFGICINKRTAGVTSRKWDILPIDDSAEAKAQAETVKKMFLKSDALNQNGLTEAISQLCLAAFRGRACVKPFINEKNELYFKKIQNWNTLEWNGKLYWNPTATYEWLVDERGNVNTNLPELTEDEICYVVEERPVDIPGIQIYLRQLVGEDGWAKATERYGVAQIVLTAPDGTPDDTLDVWNQRAIALFEGGSGVLPAGTNVSQMTDARGQDPFSSYVEHQMEMIVLLACGEKMTTLGGAAGLGSNLAEIQSQEFQNLVNHDAKRISNTMTRCAVKKCVEAMFPGKEQLCRFEFVEQDDITPKEYLEMATSLHSLGVSIDVAELKKATGLQFIRDDVSDVWTPQKSPDYQQ